jgi:expansin (peptidoglycan-binding protein)
VFDPFTGIARALAALVAAAATTMAAPHGAVTAAGTTPKAATKTTSTSGAAVRGQATHYGPASRGGNCMFPTIPASRFTVAAGPDLYAAGAACGGYVSITGPHRTILAKIDNKCPECKPGHLDLSDEAFAALAPLGKGLIPITYRLVTNPAVAGGLTFVVKSGSSRYWLGLLVDNAGNRLRSVEVQVGSRRLALSGTDYGYWLANGGAGSGPFTVRVTDVAGHRAVARNVRLALDQVQRTSVRLYR